MQGMADALLREGKPTHRPCIEDLRGGKLLREVADVVLLVHTEDYYHRADPDYESTGITEVVLAKPCHESEVILPMSYTHRCRCFDALF